MGTGCSAERSASLVQLNKSNIPNYKIVLIGDPGAGKTNVLLRYSKNQFDYSYTATRKPSIVNVVKKLNVPTNVVVSVTLWDLPGREDMDLRSTYYKNVDAVVVVVDMSDESSIELATTWRQDFLNKASRTKEVEETLPSGITTTRVEPVKGFQPRAVPMLLLGNKYDLVEERLKQEEMKKMLEKTKENPIDELKEQLIYGDDENKDDDTDQNNQKPADKTTTAEKNDKNKDISPTKKEEVKDELAALIDRDEDGSDSEEDEEDEEGRDRLFTPQRGQNTKKNLPHCVRLLEQIETEKGFVGSIMVSAKDKDGSVDAAIQSLVRHLLDKSSSFPKQPKKPTEKKHKKKRKLKKVKQNGFQPLANSGVADLDAMFKRCNIVLRRVFEYTTFHQVALHKFKQGCADEGLLTDTRVSLEDCIVGVRDAMRQRMSREILLQDEEEGFVRLHYDVDEDEDSILLKQQRNFVSLLKDFHEEYCAISRAILRESPSLEVLLDKLDSRVSGRAEQIWAAADNQQQQPAQQQPATTNTDSNNTLSRSEAEKVCDICEKNRARLAHAKLQVKENVDNVNAAADKVRNALIW